MKAQELINKFKELQYQALQVASLYQKLFWKDTTKINIDKPNIEFTHFRLEPDYGTPVAGCFTVSYSYNDSCNCHPEYRDWEEQLPVGWLDLYGMDLEEAILDFIKQKIEDRQKEIESAEKKTEQENKKKKQEQEKLERETFESLKKKYGN